MSATTEKPGSKPQQMSSSHSVLEWLDSLTAGTCDAETFSRAITGLIRRAPDASWEVLSLLDQYYRRGKIKPELFQSLKARFQSGVLGTNDDKDLNLPARTERVAPPPTAAIPVPATAHAPSQPMAPTDAGAAHTERVATAARAPAPAPAPGSLSPPHSPTIVTSPISATDDPAERHRPRIFTGDVLRQRYRLQRVLGQGETGIVFEAIDEYNADFLTPGQKVALKLFHPSVAADESLFLEIRREFQELQSLSHPNIVRVHAFDRDAGASFYTMELLNGSSLSRLLRTREQAPMESGQAFTVIRRVGEAMLHARSRNVLQGSVSARNIFITDDGEVRVLDFDTVQAPDAPPPGALDDPYSLAIVAYMLLSGNHPYQNRTSVEARSFGLTARRPPGLTRSQWHALRSGLYFERERRPQGIAEWLHRLDPRADVGVLPRLAVLENGPKRRNRARSFAWGAAALVVVVAAIGAWAALNPETATELGDISAHARTAAVGSATFIGDKLHSLHKPAAPNATPETDDTATVATPPAATDAIAGPAPPVQPPTAARQTSASAAQTPGSAAQTPGPAAQTPGPASQPPTTALSRIEFATDTTEVAPGERAAHVVVRRKNSYRNGASFTWWTESGTAKPGADFVGVTPHEAVFESGKDLLTLEIPLVSGSARVHEKNFYVVIDQPSAGAILGAKTLSMVSIVPN